MAAKLTRLIHKIAIQLHLVSGRDLYHLLFSLQAANPGTFGYTLVYSAISYIHMQRCHNYLLSTAFTWTTTWCHLTRMDWAMSDRSVG